MKYYYTPITIIICLMGFLGMFHIVNNSRTYTIVPKLTFTFSDTFITVHEVIERYNNKDFAERLRGDPQFDNLVRVLQSKELISKTSKTSKPETESNKSSPKQNTPTQSFEKTDYVDIKSAVLDGKNAEGKSIRFFAKFKKIEMYVGNPALDVWADTETGSSLWNITFDESYKNVVSGFTEDQRLHIICTITRMGSVLSTCQLIKFLAS